MACDVRIAIATHGAVWSHRMDIAAKTLGQDSETVKVDSKSVTKVVTTKKVSSKE